MNKLLRTFDPFRCSREGNYPLPADPLLSDAVSSANDSLKSCNEEILRMPRHLQRLKTKRAKIVRYTEACQSLSVPSAIRELPTELLSRIFEEYCEETIRIRVTEIQNKHSTVHAIRLSHVCFRWKSILRSLEYLVPSVAVELINTQVISDVSISILPKILGLCPTSNEISISLFLGPRYSTLSREGPLYRILLPYLARIRSLSLENCEQFLMQPPNTFYSLHSLNLGRAPLGAKEVTTADLAKAAPNLHTLFLHEDSSWLVVNWINLRRISLENCTVKYMLTTLAGCRKLEVLEVGLCAPEKDVTIPCSVTLPTLKSYRQGMCAPAFIQAFQDHVYMPSLEHYTTLRYVDADGPSDVLPLSLGASGSTVTRLKASFLQVANSSEELEAIFELSPRIEDADLDMALEIGPDSGAVLDLLAWPALPSLRHLKMRTGDKYFPAEKFVSMVKSRWYADEGRKIESVQLSVKPFSSVWICGDEMWEELSRMMSEGLRVHVEDGRGSVRTRVERSKRAGA